MDLSIAMIGVGGLGYLQAETFAGIDGVHVEAAADVNEEARTLFEETFRAPAYEHYRQLFHEQAANLDAVAVVTPHTLHYEHAKAAIEQGLHVLVEKPMVTNVADGVDLIESAAANDAVLQVGYQRHFHPAFREIRRLVDDGRIGDLHTVNCYLGQDWIDVHADSWRTDPSLSGGGQLYDTGSHLLDALLWTTGADPQHVTGSAHYAEPEVDVNTAISLDMDRDGSSVVASVGLSGDGVAVEPDEGYVFWGEEGQLTYTGDRIEIDEKDGMNYTSEVTGDVDFEALNRRKIENFAGSIEGTVAPAVPGEVGLRVTALTEAIYEATSTGSTVPVQPIIEGARATGD